MTCIRRVFAFFGFTSCDLIVFAVGARKKKALDRPGVCVMARGRSRSDSRSRSRGRGKGGRGDDQEHIQQMVDERQAARRDRDFDKADRMREELKELGVRIDAGLEDLEVEVHILMVMSRGCTIQRGNIHIIVVHSLRESVRGERLFILWREKCSKAKDDTQLTWNAPGGLRGVVNNPGGKGPIEKRDGDWICRSCGKLVFATKE